MLALFIIMPVAYETIQRERYVWAFHSHRHTRLAEEKKEVNLQFTKYITITERYTKHTGKTLQCVS